MNPLLKTAAKHAVPHLASLNSPRNRKMLKQAGRWAAGQVVRKKKYSMGMAALKGLGVAALAIPVGMWVGKRLLGTDRE